MVQIPWRASIAQRIRLKIDELGRESPVTGPGYVNGRHFTTHVTDVHVLKKASKLDEAEERLLNLIAAVEAEAVAEPEMWKHDPAPWYYKELGILYRKRGDHSKEVAILERYFAKSVSDVANYNTTAAEPVDRLKKARALLHAHDAKPASDCPYCGVEITPPPKASVKCPACRGKAVRVKRPGEETAALLTVEQAEENKKAVSLERARRKALDHARKIGCSDDEFAAKERELAEKRGKKPSPSDVFWGLSNDLLGQAPSFDKHSRWAKLRRIYEHQVRVLIEAGKAHTGVAREANKAHLHQLEKMCQESGLKQEVHIAAESGCCLECAKLNGQRMSFAQAFETLPIPNEQCEHERCCCSWKVDY